MSDSLPVYPALRADPATPAGLSYTRLRATEPVSRMVMPSDHTAWLVT